MYPIWRLQCKSALHDWYRSTSAKQCDDFLKEQLICIRSHLDTCTVDIQKKGSILLPVWLDFYDFSNSCRLILFIMRLEFCHCYVMLSTEFIYRQPWVTLHKLFYKNLCILVSMLLLQIKTFFKKYTLLEASLTKVGEVSFIINRFKFSFEIAIFQ